MTYRTAVGQTPKINSRAELAQYIDATKLVFNQGEHREDAIRKLCESAVKENFRAVCVRPEDVLLARQLLEGTLVKVATVIGFPRTRLDLEEERRNPTLGGMGWEMKVAEMKQTLADGVDEFDVVMNIPYLREATTTTTESPLQYELAQIVEHCGHKPIKLIIETEILTDEEIAMATQMAINTGIQYVKTSTGMFEGGRGATDKDIKLIRRTIDETAYEPKPGIKASGGIKTGQQAWDLIHAGADIIGTSSPVELLNDFERERHKTFDL